MRLTAPWLVAAWPGMGAVAHLALSALAERLRPEPLGELAPDDYFDLAQVRVERGLLLPLQLPRTRLFGCAGEEGARDLVLLAGDQQPAHKTKSFCDEALARARELGVQRVFTFAAMATPSPPDRPARVFGVASDPALLADLRERGVEELREGEISGMNGVFLAAAVERGLAGACLLGEFPFFAGGVPQPKAAAAVLRVFAGLAGLTLDLSDLDRQGREVERQLVAHLRRLEDKARRSAVDAGEEAAEEWKVPQDEPAEPTPEVRARIEALFREAGADRTRALALKAELDRLGLFGRYEDRFLDLFRQAE